VARTAIAAAIVAGWFTLAGASSARPVASAVAARPAPAIGRILAPPAQDVSAAAPAGDHQTLLRRYCITCHNERQRAAGRSPLALDGLDVSRVADRADVWEKVLLKLDSGAMPPAGVPRPDAAASRALTTWLAAELDRAAAAHPNPGQRPALHRLNRAEYGNAIRDLLALDDLPRELDIASLLPADDASYGFDNIADALGTTPTLIERYLTAARKISALAVGDPSQPVLVDRYPIPLALPQGDRVDGLPYGTRGGIGVRQHFPLDGEYTIQVGLNVGRVSEAHQLEVAVDGVRAQLVAIGGETRERPARPADLQYVPTMPPVVVKQRVTAGPHLVTVAFVKRTSALAEDVLAPFTRTGQGGAPLQPSIGSVTISGPHGDRAPGDTPSRRRIFACRPATAAEERRCADQILSTLARRAYRRPVTSDDLRVLTAFYDEGRAEGTFERGVQRAIERMLVSPAFLFRVEQDRSPSAGAGRAARAGAAGARATVPGPGGAGGADVWRISDVELATRLSFFLWSSIPDDELLDEAARGRLSDPAVLDHQVARMLADPRAAALGQNFAAQWLSLRSLKDASPDPRLYPDFDEGLRDSMRRETELFFEDVVRADRSVLDFLTATDTFVNERLARHYGIPHVYGDRFRRVARPAATRRGILGHASVLTVTSYAHRTSPVLRGKWILETVLGSPPPPPPPDVPTLVEKNSQTEQPFTMREALERHRANPACASCHARMDPLGFAFENFDAVGRWRTVSAGVPVDATGVLPEGARFDGAQGLIDLLLERPDQFVRAVTERLMTYGLGRGVEYHDAPAIRAITRDAARSGYRFASIVAGIVRSVPFQMRARVSAPPAQVALK
jgi:hypothetical protein